MRVWVNARTGYWRKQPGSPRMCQRSHRQACALGFGSLSQDTSVQWHHTASFMAQEPICPQRQLLGQPGNQATPLTHVVSLSLF